METNPTLIAHILKYYSYTGIPVLCNKYVNKDWTFIVSQENKLDNQVNMGAKVNAIKIRNLKKETIFPLHFAV